jgi:hypothetical protein
MKRIAQTLLTLLLLFIVPVASARTHHRRHHYINSSGHRIHSPAHSRSAPVGASAQCNDGTYSFSEHHQGTCSHHGGVARWLH